MVECGANVGYRRTNREMWANPSASHDASDRASISTRFYIFITKGTGLISFGISGATGFIASGSNLQKLAVSRRWQSSVEREMSRRWCWRSQRFANKQEKELSNSFWQLWITLETSLHEAAQYQNELENSTHSTSESVERSRRSCHYVFTVLRQ